MTRRRWATAALILAVCCAGLAFPRDGFCLDCLWKGTCYTSSICGDCICVKKSNIDVSGFCAWPHP